MSSIKLGPGDACIVVRADLSLMVALPTDGGEAEWTVIGLVKALENEEWRQKLVARAKESENERLRNGV